VSGKRQALNKPRKPGPPSAPVNVASWLTVAVLCAMVLWSARALFDYGELFIKLSGKSLVERGRVGSDEWSSFLARAGRPPMQRIFADAQRRGIADRQRSGVANAWAAIAQTENTLPPDGNIYLNVPNLVLYYYGTTIWYPRRLDANTKSVMIKDGDTLQSNSAAVDANQFGELRRLGYTHIITAEGIQLLPSAGSPGGGKP
jgi:hypothetical protein